MPDTALPATTNAIYSMVYTSSETEPFTTETLTRLLASSRLSNEAAEVTGVLLYRRGRFVQYLEGNETTVRALVQRISQDTRHRGVRTLTDNTTEPRQFSHWTMGFVTEDTQPGSMPIGFRTAFNDIDNLNSDADAAALRALRELSLWFRHQPTKS